MTNLWAVLKTAWKLPTKRRPGLILSNLKYSSTARLGWQGILFSFAIVSVSTTLLLVFNMAPYNVNMVFMLLTLVATVWFGLGTGVLTAVLGFLCFDYFFIPPYFTFVIDAGQGWTAVFLFLGTALFANQVAGRSRESNRQALRRAQEATALYDLATAVITKIDQDEMLRLVLQKVSEALNTADCILYLAGESEKIEQQLVQSVQVENINKEHIFFLTRPQPDPSLAEAVFKQKRLAFYSGPVVMNQASLEPDFSSSDSQTLKSWSVIAYVPLAYGSEVVGVMALVSLRSNEGQEFSPEEKRLIQVFANHVALAVEHARLIKEAAKVAALRDSDRLKSALLASVSHELRTPLTSIKTATANLQAGVPKLSEAEQTEILGIIEQETERLTRLVSNLLDLSKIEAHALKPNFGWYYLPEIVTTVVRRLKQTPLLQDHPLTTSFPPDLPLARLDFLQIDQVLTNLIENAARYSTRGSPIAVQVECLQGGQIISPSGKEASYFKARANEPLLVVKVLDEGQTIPPGEFERIFDKFYRLQTTAGPKGLNVPGTGLGLAISKGIIEAHDGKIWAQNRLYGGNIFTFVLPGNTLAESQEFEEDEEEI